MGELSLWWVRHEGGEPIGPVEEELLVRGILAGKVPRGAHVCRIASNAWRPLGEVEPFATAARALGPPSAPVAEAPAAPAAEPAPRGPESSIPPPLPVPALTEAEERALSTPGVLPAVVLPSSPSLDDAPELDLELVSAPGSAPAIPDAPPSDERATAPAPGVIGRPAFMALTSEFFRAGDDLAATPRASTTGTTGATGTPGAVPDAERSLPGGALELERAEPRRRSPALATVGLVLLLCALAVVVALLRG
ncbi:MAG: hypothetical protein IT373_27760 [Polyangiaceae bacterium]|nr:hypothetical protein [Polyangiaceae bacterium]